MKRFWSVLFAAHEQPDEQTWLHLDRIVEEWNAGPGKAIDTTVPFLRQITFSSHEHAARDLLFARLDRVDGAVLHVNEFEELDEADYAASDFVGIFGIDPADEFVRNADSVLVPGGPCGVCGLQDSFDVVQSGPFEIDTACLHGAPDVVNLPGGGLAVSRRILEDWRAQGFTGWREHDLIDVDTGEASATWCQLSADRAVLTPCPEHTIVDGAPYCQGCGRAFGELIGPFFVRLDLVGDVELFARHPSQRAMFYVGQGAFAAMRALDARGLNPRDQMQRCSH